MAVTAPVPAATSDLLGDLRNRLNTGTVTMDDLGRLLAPTLPVTTGTDVPAPVVVSEAATAAWGRLLSSLAVPLPSTVRSLSEGEIVSLLDARATITEVEKVIKDAKESIRTAVLNHLDLAAAADPAVTEAAVDSKGHILRSASLSAPGTKERFSWEVSAGKAKVDEAALLAMVETGELSREDFNAVTVPVRVFDEAKFLVEVRKSPWLVGTVFKALTPRSVTAALFIRKNKAAGAGR
jgi:hypothetical protein